MKKENIQIIVSIFVAGLFIVSGAVLAQSSDSIDTSKVAYPIAELGSCKDKADCASFCEKSENMLACVTYAENNGLMKGEDLRMSKLVAAKVSKGETPGGCKTREECEGFCKGKVANIEKCVAFAEELGVLPKAELDQAKNVLKALQGGAKMPGQCAAKEDCEKYCANGSHIDECLSFAEAANILSGDELKQAKAVAPFLKNGETPGKCQGKAECDNYCADSSHSDECISFAEKVGFISKDDAEMARKVGGAGPGGCKDKASCETYCNDEANATECANFAVEKGLVDEKTAELIKTGVDQMNQAMNSMPAELKTVVTACVDNALGAGKFQQILNKEISLTKDNGDKVKTCFDDLKNKAQEIMMNSAGSAQGGQQGSFGPSGQQGGPAGATGPGGQGAPEGVDIPSGAGLRPGGGPNEQQGFNPGSGVSGNGPGIGRSLGIPGGVVPAGGTVPTVSCDTFAQVPACSYVPEIVRDQCQKCKGE